VEFDPEAAIATVAKTRPALLTVYALRWTMQQGDKYAPYKERWGFSLSPESRAEVEAHLARGGGILALHTAIICFDDWAGWKEILAGRWEWGRSSHPPYGSVEVRPDAPDHPLVAGLPAFNLDDEAYGNLDLDARVQPLLHVRARSGDLAAGVSGLTFTARGASWSIRSVTMQAPSLIPCTGGLSRVPRYGRAAPMRRRLRRCEIEYRFSRGQYRCCRPSSRLRQSPRRRAGFANRRGR
jgi:hypothetical protein